MKAAKTVKKVRLMQGQQHPKGNIPKGSVYNFNESSGFYEYKINGLVVSTVNEAAVNQFPEWFRKIIE